VSAQGPPFGDLVISPSLTVPAKALRWNFSRSSGPGGQGVNTADSRVELSVHLPSLSNWPEQILATALVRLSDRLVDGTVTVSASEHRQQHRRRPGRPAAPPAPALVPAAAGWSPSAAGPRSRRAADDLPNESALSVAGRDPHRGPTARYLRVNGVSF